MNKRPDYLVSIWGVRCYMIDGSMPKIWGTNKFNDWLLAAIIEIQLTIESIIGYIFLGYEGLDFKIRVLKEYYY